MLRHNLKIAWRVLKKNISYTAINYLGITVGIAISLLIGLYIQHELSYDKYHQNYKNIYRLANKVEGASYENGIAKISAPWGPAVVSDIPEVSSMCRFIFFGESLFEKNKERFYESGGFYTDSTVFDIFNWPLIAGDKNTCLQEPNSIVLTESFAEKYFGKKDPLGEFIRVDNTNLYRVSGIMKSVPSNSHFHFDFLASMSSYTHPDMNNWVRWPQFYTYLLLKPGASSAILTSKIDNLLSQHLDSASSAAYTPILQPLADIHLHSDLFREMEANSNIIYVYIFGSLAVFIILIACLNFINLATAQVSKRANEVGIRKVAGASRKSLMGQYLGEAFIIGIVSMFSAIVLANFLLPYLNTFLEQDLRFNWYHNPVLIIGLILLTIFIVLLSGIYPAWILSSYKPVKVIGDQIHTSRHFNMRKVLVVFQFVISIVMIMAAMVSSSQMNYIHNKNLGFNKDQVLNVPIRDLSLIHRIDFIKDQLSQVPGVEKISASANRPGGSDFGVPANMIGIPADQQPPLRCLVVDQDFLDTYQIEVADGRGFKKEFASDTSVYLINEEAARQAGLKNPVGQLMEMPAIQRGPAPIVGVVKDFNFRSLHEKISPLFFFIEQNWFSQLSIRIKTENMEKTISQLRDKWASIDPAHPFTYTFFDETFNNMYRSEVRTASLVKVFAFLAIFIACLGLLGLSAFTAAQRTKEIGIRKVLGASVTGITAMLSKDFLKLVLIAACFAFPLAWWATNKWLEDFAYRIHITAGFFIVSGLITLAIAFLTVSFHAAKTALSNPVKILRTE